MNASAKVENPGLPHRYHPEGDVSLRASYSHFGQRAPPGHALVIAGSSPAESNKTAFGQRLSDCLTGTESMREDPSIGRECRCIDGQAVPISH